MDNQPNICIDAQRPEVRVSGAVESMEMQAPGGGIELQVECRRLDGFLLRPGQPAEAVGEGVSDQELRGHRLSANHWLHRCRACFETRPAGPLLSMRFFTLWHRGMSLTLRKPRSGRLEGRPAPIQSPDREHLHHLVAEVVDDLDGNAAGSGLGEWPRDVAVEAR